MQEPLISIIVPIYKVEPYLKRCIDSIIDQTYKNLEIILVDDGSPDNCPQICDEYAAKDSRIIVIHQDNQGLSAARNAGLDICKGEYISFIDSDDWIESEYINISLAKLNDFQADIAIVNHIQEKNDTSVVYKGILEDCCCKGSEALTRLIKEAPIQFITSWGKLYKKHLFANLRFPIGQINEDQRTSYILFFNSYKIVCINKILYHYTKRNNSIMGVNPEIDYTSIREEQALFLKQHDYHDLSFLIYYRLFWIKFKEHYLSEQSCKIPKEDFIKLKFYIDSIYKEKSGINPLPYILSILLKIPSIYTIYRKIIYRQPKQ